MSDRLLPSLSLPEGAESLLSTTPIAAKPRKPKLLRKLHLLSSGPSLSMEVPVAGDTLSEISQTPNGLNDRLESRITSPQHSAQIQASKATSMYKDQSSEPLPPGLPYASVLRW